MASESSELESSDQGSDNSNQGSDNSDQGSDVYDWGDFVVVRTYVNDKDRYDCIPTTWVIFNKKTGRGYQSIVDYRFPSLAQLGKGIKFRKNQKPKKTWPRYRGKMLRDVDTKEEGFRYIEYMKEKDRKFYEEDGLPYPSSTSELDSEEDNATKDNKNKKKQGTKRKQSEQGNKSIKKKLELEKIEVAKQLHSQCNNFYEDLNATHQKSLSILDKTADYLQKIITAQKAKLPA